MVSLLPSNATPLEKSLEAAFQSVLDVSELRGFKFKEDAMPFIFEDLVQEYGLESIRLWIQDALQVLKEGVFFQRLRGTPAAMKMALKWMGLEKVRIEEEPAGKHFAEFQLGLEELPSDFSIEAILALADMAKPARARLTRLYNSLYDRRHLVLDENIYGDFLSGYSGIFLDDLQISFGRQEIYEVQDALTSEPAHSALHHHVQNLLNHDIFRFGESYLDEEKTELLDPGFVHEHAFNFEVVQGVSGESIRKTSSCLAKSQLVLSDGFVLDSENTALSAFYVQETGRCFQLDYDTLSNHEWKQRYVEILERFVKKHTDTVVYDEIPVTQSFSVRERESIVCDSKLSAVCLKQRESLASEVTYTGVLLWHDHKHLERKWCDEDAVINFLNKNNYGRDKPK